jgi:hypothetical protein
MDRALRLSQKTSPGSSIFVRFACYQLQKQPTNDKQLAAVRRQTRYNYSSDQAAADAAAADGKNMSVRLIAADRCDVM